MFEWLEHAWATNDTGAVSELLTDPFLRAYKDDPRFIAFAQKVGVMPKAARQAVIGRFFGYWLSGIGFLLRAAPLLGLAPRRSALRGNRRIARAETMM